MPPVRKPKPQLRRHFLRQWRKHRGLSQEKAAGRFGIDRTTLSRIERALSPYNQALLEAAAVAYNCEPWDLLNVDPTKEREVVDFTAVLRDATPAQRSEILGYARGVIGGRQPN